MGIKILLYCFIFLNIMRTAPSAADDILIVTEEWPPYNYLEAGELTGFSTEIVRHILETLNKTHEIHLLPSMRASMMLKKGPRTMLFSMFRTPERAPLYKWIGPLGDGTISFYKRKENPIRIESMADIKHENVTICSRHAGLIPNLLRKLGFENVDMGGTTGLQVYQKLLAGRCDLAVSDTDLGVRHELKQLNLNMDDALEKIPIPIYENELYIACSRDIPDKEIQLWQAALEAMKTNGSYNKIFQKYYRRRSTLPSVK